MKKQYIKPTVKSVEFQVEMGFAMSGVANNGVRLFENFNFDLQSDGDINGNDRFTRSTDLGGNVWHSDGNGGYTNSGYWD